MSSENDSSNKNGSPTITKDMLVSLVQKAAKAIETSVGVIHLYGLRAKDVDFLYDLTIEDSYERFKELLPRIASLSAVSEPGGKREPLAQEYISQLSEGDLELLAEAYAQLNEFEDTHLGADNRARLPRDEEETAVSYLDRLLRKQLEIYTEEIKEIQASMLAAQNDTNQIVAKMSTDNAMVTKEAMALITSNMKYLSKAARNALLEGSYKNLHEFNNAVNAKALEEAQKFSVNQLGIDYLAKHQKDIAKLNDVSKPYSSFNSAVNTKLLEDMDKYSSQLSHSALDYIRSSSSALNETLKNYGEITKTWTSSEFLPQTLANTYRAPNLKSGYDMLQDPFKIDYSLENDDISLDSLDEMRKNVTNGIDALARAQEKTTRERQEELELARTTSKGTTELTLVLQNLADTVAKVLKQFDERAEQATHDRNEELDLARITSKMTAESAHVLKDLAEAAAEMLDRFDERSQKADQDARESANYLKNVALSTKEMVEESRRQAEISDANTRHSAKKLQSIALNTEKMVEDFKTQAEDAEVASNKQINIAVSAIVVTALFAFVGLVVTIFGLYMENISSKANENWQTEVLSTMHNGTPQRDIHEEEIKQLKAQIKELIKIVSEQPTVTKAVEMSDTSDPEKAPIAKTVDE